MNISRYEFEILNCINANGNRSYSIRELSNELCISASTISDNMKCLIQRGSIYASETGWVITEKGLKELEPYRVKRAIILAAGLGSRMMPATADRPKPMVTVNGKRIIDTLLDALIAAGVEDIIIVRGYKKSVMDDLKGKYSNLTFIDNNEYDKTNNITSIIQALDYLSGGCYICEADLFISNPKIITSYQFSSNILGSWSLQTDDWSFQMSNGLITNYQKGNSYCWNYYGISFWTTEDCMKLKKDFMEVVKSPDGDQYFWEFVPLVLCKDQYRVEIRQCNKTDIVEIDNYYELVQLDTSYQIA